MFWKRFDELSRKNGISPTALVKELFSSSSNVTTWKNGKLPNGESLLKIADYLDCSVDYLLGRTDNPEINVSAPQETYPQETYSIAALRKPKKEISETTESIT